MSHQFKSDSKNSLSVLSTFLTSANSMSVHNSETTSVLKAHCNIQHRALNCSKLLKTKHHFILEPSTKAVFPTVC